MRVAAVQYRPPKGHPATARQEIAEWARLGGDAGASLIVFPEMATTGYTWPNVDAIRPIAEPAHGETAAMLAPIAKEFGAWIIVGMPELDAGKLYNAALLIGPDGAVRGCYRKVLLFEADEPWACPGRDRPVFDIPFGRLAPGICMDLNDDAFIAHLHRAGVDIVAFCTNWIDEGHDILPYWRWRLGDFGGAFVAANSWGRDGEYAFLGASCILGPGGLPLARAPAVGDALIVADLPAMTPADS